MVISFKDSGEVKTSILACSPCKILEILAAANPKSFNLLTTSVNSSLDKDQSLFDNTKTLAGDSFNIGDFFGEAQGR
jgi:hypothetical protein